MTTKVVKLVHGLKLGEEKQLVAELREPTAGMLRETRLASERVAMTEKGPVLLPSPAMARAELLRRQIMKIGGIPGNPLSLDLFDELSGTDLKLLEDAAVEMDEHALKEVEQRGRRTGAG